MCRAGIPLPQKGWTGPEEESVYPPLEWAAGFFRRELSGRTGEAARKYLERRALGPAVQERFGLGWAPPGWSNLLEAAGKRYSLSLLERAGLDIAGATAGARWIILVVACLVGLIPQSGPHLIFVTLYARGEIPFGVLLASSIVQDGHGMLPMLAQSRRAFFLVKAVAFAAGIAAGAVALAMGW